MVAVKARGHQGVGVAEVPRDGEDTLLVKGFDPYRLVAKIFQIL